MINIEATNLPRVIACNGSVAMAAGLSPAATMPTIDQQEGTAAHFVAASVLSGRFTDPVEWVERQTPGGVYVTPEMADFVADYVNYCTDAYYQNANITTWVEEDASFEVPGARIGCRPDLIAFDRSTNTLFIEDFKYGWRLVEAEMNWTLIADALGAMLAHGLVPDHVVLAINQPRPWHTDGKRREWRISGDYLRQLHQWLSGFFINIPLTLVSGPQCDKCLALASCPAARKAEVNAIDTIHTTVFRDDMPNDDLRQSLLTIERAKDMLELRYDALKELARSRIKAGAVVDGYAVEQSFGNSTFKPEFRDPEALKALTGVDLRSDKLLTPNQAIKAGAPEAIIAALTYRPPTGERLVKRNASKQGAKLFGAK